MRRKLVRIGAAALWVHQGLWCKVLGREPSHRALVASVLPERWATGATRALGLGETALGGLVLVGGNRRTVAAVQTGAILAFNAGGLAFGPAHIPHPVRLLARNAAVLALVWSAVDA